MENSKSILEKIEKINCQGNTKAISIFDFSTLCTKFPHSNLISALNNIIEFPFKEKIKKKSFLEVQVFGVTNTNTCIFYKKLFLKDSAAPY